MGFDPNRIATEYYFGELQYWKLPQIAGHALELGYDGPALRKLAGLANPVRSDIQDDEVDSAFRELGVVAPITKERAQLALAAESAKSVVDGRRNAFEAATHIRICLCHLSEPPEPLKRIVLLSNEAGKAPRRRWKHIETELRDAFEEFLMGQKSMLPSFRRSED